MRGYWPSGDRRATKVGDPIDFGRLFSRVPRRLGCRYVRRARCPWPGLPPRGRRRTGRGAHAARLDRRQRPFPPRGRARPRQRHDQRPAGAARPAARHRRDRRGAGLPCPVVAAALAAGSRAGSGAGPRRLRRGRGGRRRHRSIPSPPTAAGSWRAWSPRYRSRCCRSARAIQPQGTLAGGVLPHSARSARRRSSPGACSAAAAARRSANAHAAPRQRSSCASSRSATPSAPGSRVRCTTCSRTGSRCSACTPARSSSGRTRRPKRSRAPLP